MKRTIFEKQETIILPNNIRHCLKDTWVSVYLFISDPQKNAHTIFSSHNTHTHSPKIESAPALIIVQHEMRNACVKTANRCGLLRVLLDDAVTAFGRLFRSHSNWPRLGFRELHLQCVTDMCNHT